MIMLMLTTNVMLMRNIFWIVVLQLWITVNGSAGNESNKISEANRNLKCSSGKLPLLDESSLLFPCQRGCPHTFYCETQNSISICCPNSTEIARVKIASGSVNSEIGNMVVIGEQGKLGFQFENSKEFENSISCERYEYRESCNQTDSQPQAKWYYDVQTLSCEVYPFGVCKDDPIAYLALRTKEECEKKCDVAKLKKALENLKESSTEDNKVEEEATETTTIKVKVLNESGNFETIISPTSSKYAQIAPLAIEDPVVESKHVKNRPIAVEPPTDLIHSIHTPSDSDIINIRISDDAELLTGSSSSFSSTDLPLLTSSEHQTVTSDTLTIADNATEISGDFEGSGSEENSGESGELNEQIIHKSRRKNLKSMEDSFERFYKANKEVVVCEKTEYRLFCKKGIPSQFVYRWELLNGVCQSFPYGYCLYETNVAHPRTKEECETFCE